MTGKATERYSLTARVSEFSIPPIRDGLVIGQQSPIGITAINIALSPLIANSYHSISLDDPIFGNIFVRSAIVRRSKWQLLG